MFQKIICFFSSMIMVVFGNLGLVDYKAKVPVNFSTYTMPKTELVENADFYVSTDGNDSSDGSLAHPFKTIEKAKSAVRELDKNGRENIVVAVKSGDYRISNLNFDVLDSGTKNCTIKYCAYGDGEVALNGGISISPSEFTKVNDKNILKRLSKNAKKNVVCYDLNKIGVTAEDYGKMYAIGTYNTAYKYTGDTVGPLYCELFVNDKRQTIARYPDDTTLKTGKVIVEGYGSENSNKERNTDWNNSVNPVPDTYAISNKIAKRINSWETLDDVWMMGCWMYDWADASTPIGSFDYKNKTLQTKYVSQYGAKKGADYYFYNVLEEITTPGEWYLDRENGIIYLYPESDFKNACIDLSLSTKTIITGENVDYITFEGFTIKGTRSTALNISGNNITVKNCLVKNVAEHAIVLTGYNNLAYGNEITHTGKGGIYINGGDTTNLIAGNSKADNNLIHDWSDIYTTYQPAVTLSGVGNTCSHNEIYNSPHEAITYSGNNHIIEYNIVHDVCLNSNDAGAIYSGRSWFWYGNIIRYNCIYNLGSKSFSPVGIYLDDALSGQTVYGNILVNIPNFGIQVGGGRDNNIQNNIIINAGNNSIDYDSRAIDMICDGWFNSHVKEGGTMWKELEKSPYKTQKWQDTFPAMKDFITDFSKISEPGFLANPANSIVENNIVVNLDGKLGGFAQKVNEYSTIENNYSAKITKANRIFEDFSNGDFTLCKNSLAREMIPDFEDIPVSKIGRY